MYEKLEQCPACKHPKSTNSHIITDHSISEESFALMICNQCKLVYTNPRPDQESIWKYYESNEYISHTDQTHSVKDFIYKQVRKYAVRQKLTLLKKYHKNPRILDYGAGAGYFLSYVTHKGLDAIGIEPAKEKALKHQVAIKNKVYESIDEIDKEDKVDIITAWHVLEHVHELRSTFKQLKKLLKDDGYMFIALPNHLSYDSQYYKDHWAGYDVPRHLYHFDRSSLKYFAKDMKMKIVNIYPMYFDAFYVSMLSEQYLGNKTAFFKGLQLGYQSNLRGKKSGEYSSLIYVMKK